MSVYAAAAAPSARNGSDIFSCSIAGMTSTGTRISVYNITVAAGAITYYNVESLDAKRAHFPVYVQKKPKKHNSFGKKMPFL